MPKINTKFGVIDLNYSNHALQAANNDRYGNIDLPDSVDTNKAKLIELEVVNNRYLSKIVYRMEYDSEYDICIVIIPERWFVKTVWLNRKSDKHRTLDRSKYQLA